MFAGPLLYVKILLFLKKEQRKKKTKGGHRARLVVTVLMLYKPKRRGVNSCKYSCRTLIYRRSYQGITELMSLNRSPTSAYWKVILIWWYNRIILEALFMEAPTLYHKKESCNTSWCLFLAGCFSDWLN